MRVESAGVRIIESRLAHLAYAPEVVGAMLQRQQAGAVVSARERIVEGAVGMVDIALARWAADELRSTNAQIDYLLREALRAAGRLPKDAKPARPRGRPRSP